MTIDRLVMPHQRMRRASGGAFDRPIGQDATTARLAQLALDAGDDGILLFAADGRIIRANPALSRRLGYGPVALRGLTVADLIPVLSGGVWAKHWRHVGDSLGAVVCHTFRCRDGSAVILAVRSRRLLLDGEAYGCAFIRDPEARDQELAEWCAAMAEAHHASQAKSAFLAAISHELRTPLNAILGFSEILAEELFGQLGNERYRSYVRDIRASGHHLLQLVNNLLDLSKIEAEGFTLEESSVSIGELIKTSMVFVERQAAASEVMLVNAIAPELPQLWADPIRLKQIMINLLGNAVKFTPAGGRVTIGAHATTEGGVALWVADTGCGMTAAEMRDAVQPYRQGAAGRAREGTGLGLPLSKALAEAHGAALRLHSAPGAGTTVTVTFPATRSTQAQ